MANNVIVFDSGVGGTSVAGHIRAALPDIHIHYVMDNACLPYGLLSGSRVIERVNSVVSELCAITDKTDLLVIACNTASTQVLESIRQWAPFPVVGVVPAIKPAALLCRSGKLGLLATPSTIANPYTIRLVEQFAVEAEVLNYASVNLVALAEEKFWTGKDVTESVAEELANIGIAADLDALVLGCTHFPLLESEITNALPHTRLIDSGEAIARRVETLLSGRENAEEKGRTHYYATAPVNTAKLPIRLLGSADLIIR